MKIDQACPPAEMLAAYLDHSLQEFEEVSVEGHLAACTDCRLTARRLVAAGDLLHHAFSSAAGLERNRVLLTQALAEEELQSGPELRARLQTWHEVLAGTSRSLLEALKRAALPQEAETRAALEKWGLVMPLELALPTLGPKRRGLSRRRLAPPTSTGGLKFTWVDENNVEVELTDLPENTKSAVVLLVPVRRAPEFRRRAILNPDPKNQLRWVARFENVEAGSYLLALEPLKGE